MSSSTPDAYDHVLDEWFAFQNHFERTSMVTWKTIVRVCREFSLLIEVWEDVNQDIVQQVQALMAPEKAFMEGLSITLCQTDVLNNGIIEAHMAYCSVWADLCRRYRECPVLGDYAQGMLMKNRNFLDMAMVNSDSWAPLYASVLSYTDSQVVDNPSYQHSLVESNFSLFSSSSMVIHFLKYMLVHANSDICNKVVAARSILQFIPRTKHKAEYVETAAEFIYLLVQSFETSGDSNKRDLSKGDFDRIFVTVHFIDNLLANEDGLQEQRQYLLSTVAFLAKQLAACNLLEKRLWGINALCSVSALPLAYPVVLEQNILSPNYSLPSLIDLLYGPSAHEELIQPRRCRPIFKQILLNSPHSEMFSVVEALFQRFQERGAQLQKSMIAIMDLVIGNVTTAVLKRVVSELLAELDVKFFAQHPGLISLTSSILGSPSADVKCKSMILDILCGWMFDQVEGFPTVSNIALEKFVDALSMHRIPQEILLPLLTRPVSPTQRAQSLDVVYRIKALILETLDQVPGGLNFDCKGILAEESLLDLKNSFRSGLVSVLPQFVQKMPNLNTSTMQTIWEVLFLKFGARSDWQDNQILQAWKVMGELCTKFAQSDSNFLLSRFQELPASFLDVHALGALEQAVQHSKIESSDDQRKLFIIFRDFALSTPHCSGQAVQAWVQQMIKMCIWSYDTSQHTVLELLCELQQAKSPDTANVIGEALISLCTSKGCSNMTPEPSDALLGDIAMKIVAKTEVSLIDRNHNSIFSSCPPFQLHECSRVQDVLVHINCHTEYNVENIAYQGHTLDHMPAFLTDLGVDGSLPLIAKVSSKLQSTDLESVSISTRATTQLDSSSPTNSALDADDDLIDIREKPMVRLAVALPEISDPLVIHVPSVEQARLEVAKRMGNASSAKYVVLILPNGKELSDFESACGKTDIQVEARLDSSAPKQFDLKESSSLEGSSQEAATSFGQHPLSSLRQHVPRLIEVFVDCKANRTALTDGVERLFLRLPPMQAVDSALADGDIVLKATAPSTVLSCRYLLRFLTAQLQKGVVSTKYFKACINKTCSVCAISGCSQASVNMVESTLNFCAQVLNNQEVAQLDAETQLVVANLCCSLATGWSKLTDATPSSECFEQCLLQSFGTQTSSLQIRLLPSTEEYMTAAIRTLMASSDHDIFCLRLVEGIWYGQLQGSEWIHNLLCDELRLAGNDVQQCNSFLSSIAKSVLCILQASCPKLGHSGDLRSYNAKHMVTLLETVYSVDLETLESVLKRYMAATFWHDMSNALILILKTQRSSDRSSQSSYWLHLILFLVKVCFDDLHSIEIDLDVANCLLDEILKSMFPESIEILKIRYQSSQVTARPEALTSLWPVQMNQKCLLLATQAAQGLQSKFVDLKSKIISTACHSTRYKDWSQVEESQLTLLSKQTPQLCGIVNFGCTCYVNSLLQQLFMIPGFARELCSIPLSDKDMDPEADRASIVLYEFMKLLRQLRYGIQDPVEPKAFCQEFRFFDGDFIQPLQQQDSVEFFHLLLDYLERGLKELGHDRILPHFLGGKFVNQLICIDCPHRYSRQEDFSTMQLSLRPGTQSTLYDLLDHFVEGETLEGDNKYHCEQCDRKVDTLKRCVIDTLPNTLLITLKRFEFDFDTMERCKLNDFVEFPFELDMSKYTKDHFDQEQHIASNSSAPNSSLQYSLAGVVVHAGTADYGHYFSLVKSSVSSTGWFELNDETVIETDPGQFPDICFGGNMEKSGRMETSAGKLAQKTRSAYILVYHRNCQPLTKLDIVSDERLSVLQSFHAQARLLCLRQPEVINLLHSAVSESSCHSFLHEQQESLQTLIEGAVGIFLRSLVVCKSPPALRSFLNRLKEIAEGNLRIGVVNGLLSAPETPHALAGDCVTGASKMCWELLSQCVTCLSRTEDDASIVARLVPFMSAAGAALVEKLEDFDYSALPLANLFTKYAELWTNGRSSVTCRLCFDCFGSILLRMSDWENNFSVRTGGRNKPYEINHQARVDLIFTLAGIVDEMKGTGLACPKTKELCSRVMSPSWLCSILEYRIHSNTERGDIIYNATGVALSSIVANDELYKSLAEILQDEDLCGKKDRFWRNSAQELLSSTIVILLESSIPSVELCAFLIQQIVQAHTSNSLVKSSLIFLSMAHAISIYTSKGDVGEIALPDSEMSNLQSYMQCLNRSLKASSSRLHPSPATNFMESRKVIPVMQFVSRFFNFECASEDNSSAMSDEEQSDVLSGSDVDRQSSVAAESTARHDDFSSDDDQSGPEIL